jgi:hypothetical protein
MQLHFALFNGTSGYLLKPREMYSDPRDANRGPGVGEQAPQGKERDDYWPPPQEYLYCVSIHVISLHRLPKVQSRRSWLTFVHLPKKQVSVRLCLTLCCSAASIALDMMAPVLHVISTTPS